MRSKTTNRPIKGIKVSVNDQSYNYGFTNAMGKFDFYVNIPHREYWINDSIVYKPDSVKVQFLDVDGFENGKFRDTTVYVDFAHRNEVKIDMALEKK